MRNAGGLLPSSLTACAGAYPTWRYLDSGAGVELLLGRGGEDPLVAAAEWMSGGIFDEKLSENPASATIDEVRGSCPLASSLEERRLALCSMLSRDVPLRKEDDLVLATCEL